MPLISVEPTIVLTLPDGTEICREYKEGYWNAPLSLWYQLKDEASCSGWTAFDVRDLPGPFLDAHFLKITAAGLGAQATGLSFVAYLHTLGIETIEGNG